jgi:ABC-type microcin C transport system permease subunit YejB
MNWYTTLVLALTFAVVGCADKGPMEQAGEEIDEAVQDIRAGGETTGNKVDDALDDVKKGMKDAKEGVEDAIDEVKPD